MLVNQIMSQNLHTVLSNDTLDFLYNKFKEASYHHLPVVDENDHLVGIISDRDVTRNLSPFLGTDKERDCDRQLLSLKAADIMSVNPVTVIQTAEIVAASILLLENNFSCLPVVDSDGKLEGLLTWKDILNYHIYTN